MHYVFLKIIRGEIDCVGKEGTSQIFLPGENGSHRTFILFPDICIFFNFSRVFFNNLISAQLNIKNLLKYAMCQGNKFNNPLTHHLGICLHSMLRTSDGGNGNHSVSLHIIFLKKLKSIKCLHICMHIYIYIYIYIYI